jgi:hypothetical protein
MQEGAQSPAAGFACCFVFLLIILIAIGVLVVFVSRSSRKKRRNQILAIQQDSRKRRQMESYCDQCNAYAQNGIATETACTENASLLKLCEVLLLLESKLQAGMSQEKYQDALGLALFHFNSFANSGGTKFPCCMFFATKALEHYRKANDLSHQQGAVMGSRTSGGFWGGGFGLRGAAEGILIASALNALCDNSRQIARKVESLEERKREEIDLAGIHVYYLRLIVDGVRDSKNA